MQTDELKLFLLHNSLAQENGGCLKPVTFCLHFPHITGEKTFMVCLKRPVSQGELELESWFSSVYLLGNPKNTLFWFLHIGLSDLKGHSYLLCFAYGFEEWSVYGVPQAQVSVYLMILDFRHLLILVGVSFYVLGRWSSLQVISLLVDNIMSLSFSSFLKLWNILFCWCSLKCFVGIFRILYFLCMVSFAGWLPTFALAACT